MTQFSSCLSPRSAVLFSLKAYGMAIDDIDLSFRLGYPDDLAYKLYDRKAKCLVAFKQMADAELAYKAALKYVDKASKLTKEKKQQVQRDILQALQFYKAAPAALTKNQDVDMTGKVMITLALRMIMMMIMMMICPGGSSRHPQP